MHYIIGWQLTTSKFSRWFIIIQELDLEFTTPKTKKGLALSKFIIDLPTGKVETYFNDTLLDEHFFHNTTGDSWYRYILTFLHTQKFAPHFPWDDRRHIFHQAPHYLLIGKVLYQLAVDTIILH